MPIRLFLAAQDAKDLAPAYGEHICPKVSVEGMEDSDVQPLEGYRNRYLWAVIPVKKEPWTPQTFRRLAESAKFMKVDDWKKRHAPESGRGDQVRVARLRLAHAGDEADRDPVLGPAYRCPDCKDPTLQSDPPNEIKRHMCPKCKKVIENDPYFDQCMRQEYFRHRFADLRALAVAWLLTGDAKYADKALAIMRAYADAYPKMTVAGYRSTGGSSTSW